MPRKCGPAPEMNCSGKDSISPSAAKESLVILQHVRLKCEAGYDYFDDENAKFLMQSEEEENEHCKELNEVRDSSTWPLRLLHDKSENTGKLAQDLSTTSSAANNNNSSNNSTTNSSTNVNSMVQAAAAACIYRGGHTQMEVVNSSPTSANGLSPTSPHVLNSTSSTGSLSPDPAPTAGATANFPPAAADTTGKISASTGYLPPQPAAPDTTNTVVTTATSSGYGKESRKSPVRFCQVCNDYASGYHYGAWSCEGCKAFFKRSIQGPTDYVCPATNSCTIDKHRRKSCQACRLRKCLDVGMSRAGMRKERTLAQRLKLKRGAEDGIFSLPGLNSDLKVKREPVCHNQIIQQLLTIQNWTLVESGHDHSVAPSEIHLMSTLTKLGDHELIKTINWAKQAPGYVDLPLSDQVRLLECCWLEIMTLELIYRSMPYRGGKLLFAADFILNREEMAIAGISAMAEVMLAITNKFVELEVTKEEFVSLKALVLVNAEIKNLESVEKIVKIETDFVDALRDAVNMYFAYKRNRLAKLLLLLPHLRHVCAQGVAFFYHFKNEHSEVPACDLFQEMVTAQFLAQYASKGQQASEKEKEKQPSTKQEQI